MDQIIVFIVYGGRWDDNNKYVDHQVKIIMVQEGITYTSLTEKICKELGSDPTMKSIKMSFDPKLGTSRGIAIENDENVAVFLYLIQNDLDFKRCPLVVEIEEKSQSTTISEPTTNQTSSNVKVKDHGVVKEESGTNDKSTSHSCSSIGVGNSINGFVFANSGVPFSNPETMTAKVFSFGPTPIVGSSSSLSGTNFVSSSSSSTPISFSFGTTPVVGSSSSLSETNMVSSKSSSKPISFSLGTSPVPGASSSLSDTIMVSSRIMPVSFSFGTTSPVPVASSSLSETIMVSSSSSSTPISFSFGTSQVSGASSSSLSETIMVSPSSSSTAISSFSFGTSTVLGASSSLSETNFVNSSSSSMPSAFSFGFQPQKSRDFGIKLNSSPPIPPTGFSFGATSAASAMSGGGCSISEGSNVSRGNGVDKCNRPRIVKIKHRQQKKYKD
ncbi:hypothetical protein PanWU01x14_052170 [Parasponia andersonii]|uniref:Uncharacterized protein n=1 Tax=Parasponia andersonii TaxID=3476 RepID=A0A2P5DM76_PARAD|nr:hypothetical protein PanWU01x14_052170 [Parasponia andersonii]